MKSFSLLVTKTSSSSGWFSLVALWHDKFVHFVIQVPCPQGTQARQILISYHAPSLQFLIEFSWVPIGLHSSQTSSRSKSSDSPRFEDRKFIQKLSLQFSSPINSFSLLANIDI